MAVNLYENTAPENLDRFLHDLAIPLSIMKLNLQLLEGNINPSQQQYLQRLHLGWEKLDMMLKSRSSIRIASMPPTSTITSLLDELLELFATNFKHHAIRIRREYLAERAISSREVLTRVLTNIITNALEALEGYDGERTLTIRTSCKAQIFRISIHNSGRGFPEESLSELGNYQFSTKGTHRGKGLWNSNRIIRECFKGRLVFQNPRFGGALVLILIPSHSSR